MVSRILTSDTSGGITETFAYDDGSDTVIVQRTQETDPIVDHVAAVNLEGVTPIDGLGYMQAEVPLAVAIKFCEDRGIPWEKFAYTNQYDAEWLSFLRNHPKLCYSPQRRQFALQ